MGDTNPADPQPNSGQNVADGLDTPPQEPAPDVYVEDDPFAD